MKRKELPRGTDGKVTVRSAKQADLPVCAGILHTKELAGPHNWYPDVRVLKRCMGKYFLVAEKDGEILGCCVAELLKRGVIGWWFAAKRNARGKGVGSALQSALERTAKKDGKYFFLIYSKVKSPAIRFYRRRGYEDGQDFHEMIKIL